MAAIEEGGAGRRAVRGALRAVPLAPGSHLRREGALRRCGRSSAATSSRRPGDPLAGDVGGTKTALALFEERGRGQAVVREAVLASHGYAALENAIRQFLPEGPPVSIGAACVGVAGPVIDGRCTAIESAVGGGRGLRSRRASGTPRVKLVNDLEATAHGVLGLESSALATLQAGVPHKANKALIAAGTGLGEVLLAWDGRRHRVVSLRGRPHRLRARAPISRSISSSSCSASSGASATSASSPDPGSTTSTGSSWPATARRSRNGCRARMESGDPSAVVAEAALGAS